MNILEAKSISPEMTREIGERLGSRLWPGAVLTLVGELGSGKTVFAQGVLKGLGVMDKYLVSPSFVLIKEYRGRFPCYHIDLFRLKGKSELDQIGIREYLFGDGVAIIEWAEKARDVLPEDYLEIYLKFTSRKTRALSFFPKGKRYEELFKTVIHQVKLLSTNLK